MKIYLLHKADHRTPIPEGFTLCTSTVQVITLMAAVDVTDILCEDYEIMDTLKKDAGPLLLMNNVSLGLG